MLGTIRTNVLIERCILLLKIKRRHRIPFKQYSDFRTYQKLLQALIENSQSKITCCPHCQHRHIVKYGKYRDRQRYKCQNCLRTFNDLTNTPLHWTHYPQRFIKFLESMLHGYSLHIASFYSGISYVTAFYWRHKLIKVLQRMDLRNNQDQITPDKVKRYWTFPFINFRNRIPIPINTLYPNDPYKFQQWMGHFNWVAVKYLNRYLAWFQFTDRLPTDQWEINSMEKLLIQTSSLRMRLTYESLRYI